MKSLNLQKRQEVGFSEKPAVLCQYCSTAEDLSLGLGLKFLDKGKSQNTGGDTPHTHARDNKTSTESGLLLSFRKVYQVDTGHFLCKDKYYGRKLSPEGFRQALRQFLCNGNHLRTDVLEPIILQLKALLSVIRKQSSYRFYSSSLLIIYDGLEHKENTAPLDNHLQGHFQKTNCTTTHGTNHARVDVRMIDFAHTTFKGSKCNHTTYDGPDHGYIFGLENLIKILQNILEGK